MKTRSYIRNFNRPKFLFKVFSKIVFFFEIASLLRDCLKPAERLFETSVVLKKKCSIVFLANENLKRTTHFKYRFNLAKDFKNLFSSEYSLEPAVKSAQNWIKENFVNRFNVPPVKKKLDKVEQFCIFDAIFYEKKCWMFKNLAEIFAKTVGSDYSSTLFHYQT